MSQPPALETAPVARNQGISPALVLTMAVATGVTVANIYYAQPLLDTLAKAFGVPIHTAGLIVTVTQLGYAAGLMLLVPLGDLVERRGLVVTVTLLTSIALICAALAPNIELFFAASLAIGVTSVVVQILVPFAAHLAADHARGRVVGRVMSGLLLGILLARTVSGLMSDAFGWRSMFWVAAGAMLIQAAVLARVLPRDPGKARVSYPALLRSVLHLLRDEPVLRRRIVYGLCVFASFSALWTALPFLLAAPPYGYSLARIGAFGLLGVAGAMAASFAGHLHDRGHARIATGGFIALVMLAFLLMGAFPHALLALVVGVVVLDLGVQGTQILNQSAIYQLDAAARSRLTTAYMTCYFAGGAAGSAGAAYAYSLAGWVGVSAVGAAAPLLALLFWFSERR
ncbi:MFS transporter [Acidihalobacter prosperus]|uniref:Transporter n=1 Tax=Acidihalobacter prosperus TaxID=160660 RepID=A0A1A6C1N9_9GAMM|nr:MFS transporter [Acidihalobacter prosperus]OBS08473.1 transporter [Acidihalobacter prosperus]